MLLEGLEIQDLLASLCHHGRLSLQQLLPDLMILKLLWPPLSRQVQLIQCLLSIQSDPVIQWNQPTQDYQYHQQVLYHLWSLSYQLHLQVQLIRLHL